LLRHATHGTVRGTAQFMGSRLMAEKKITGRPGRKPPSGAKKQFLTSMDPEIIRRIKAAAALRDKTASLVLEEAAKDWLDRNESNKGQKRG
jgi:hypothetical protein